MKVALSQYPRGGSKTGNQPLMGYSIRNDRWRLTLWRNVKTDEIAATELYDETGDPAETVNVAGKAENREVLEALSKLMPPPVNDNSSRKFSKKETGKKL
jgi:hypothetical protein